MAALQSRALASAGFSVLQIDLHGCGDSSGDFADVSWQHWIDDVLTACAWLRGRDAAHAKAPLWIWGLRVGCLIAVQAAAQLDEPSNFCFWQPTIAGQQALQQFMRLRLASDMGSGNSKGLMGQMRQQLADGKSIDIAGYQLPPALAQGLQAAQLLPVADERVGRVEWLELSSNPDYLLSPVAEQVKKRWEDAGYSTSINIASGPAFWQTTEIEDAAELIELTKMRLLTPADRLVV